MRKNTAEILELAGFDVLDKYQKDAKEEFAISLSRDNLASIVGTSKECVIRVLSEFNSHGLLQTKQSEIKIL